MRSASRLPERWFNLVLCLIALAFAIFLIGLSSLVVGDLPQVEQRYSLEQLLDRDPAAASAETLKRLQREQEDVGRRVEQARLALEAAQSASRAARETFGNWLQTRDATQRVDQDPGLIARTEQLDRLKAGERAVEEQLDGLNRSMLALADQETEQQRVEKALRAAAQNTRSSVRRAAYGA